MIPKKHPALGSSSSARAEAPVRGQGIARQGQGRRRWPVALSGRGTPSSGDDPLKNLDLKNLNDLPLAKLSETANAVWERLKTSGFNVKVNPSAALSSQLLPPNRRAPTSPPTNGATVQPTTSEDTADLSLAGGGSGREQRLMAALAEAQEEKRQLADRTELLRANLSMLEAKNSKIAREAESAEAGRSHALRLRDMVLQERDSLALQLKDAQQEIMRASEGMEVREGALEALRQSQQQLQDELRDAVTRLQAVDRGTEDLRSQLSSLEASRAAASRERDGLAGYLQELVGKVDELSGLFDGELQAAQLASSASLGADASTSSSSGADAAVTPVSTAAAQLQQLRATTEGAFAALRVARDELGLLRSENQQLVQRSEALAGSNAELTATAEALRQQVAEAQTDALEQRRQVAALQGREAALQAALQLSASAVVEREALAQAVAELTAIKDAGAAAGLGLVELAQMATQLTSVKEQLAASRASETDLKRRLATAEVDLLDSRRAAAQTEARLGSELEAARRDAAELRAALHARSLAAQSARRSGGPWVLAEGQFVNTNRFWVPADVMFDFVKAVAAREVALVDAQGFLGIAVRSEELNVMSVSTQWESIPAFEAWSRSNAARRHHYPSGVFQYVPRRGEGFPEDYMPFKDPTEAVNAKY